MKRLILLLALLASSPAFAAISFVAGSTAGGSSATGATPAEPTGAAEDDFIFAICSAADSPGAVWTDPADFTQLDAFDAVFSGGAGDHAVYFGYKVRGSDTGSGYAFTHDATATPTQCSLSAWRGVDTTTPLDVTYVKATHYNDQTDDAAATAAQAITTSTNNAWVVLIQHFNNDGAYTAGAPSGYTLDYDNSGGANRVHIHAHKAITSAGAETPGAWTHTDVAASVDSMNLTIALKEATAITCPETCVSGTAVCITDTSSSGTSTNILNGQSPAVVANEDTLCYDATSTDLSDTVTVSAAGWVTLGSGSSNLKDCFDYRIMDAGATAGTDGTFCVGTTPVVSSPTGTATGQTTANLGATTNLQEGTLYANAVLEAEITAHGNPSYAECAAGQDGNGDAAAFAGNDTTPTTSTTVAATSLTAGTSYQTVICQKNGFASGALTSNVAVSAPWSTQAAGDITPNAFTFTDAQQVEEDIDVYSNLVTIGGIDAASNVTVTGCEMSINGGAFGSDPSTVTNGQTIGLLMRSSTESGNTENCTLTVGGVSDTWSIRTAETWAARLRRLILEAVGFGSVGGSI